MYASAIFFLAFAIILVYGAIIVSRFDKDQIYESEYPKAVAERNKGIFLIVIGALGVLGSSGYFGMKLKYKNFKASAKATIQLSPASINSVAKAEKAVEDAINKAIK
jgi:hypothetical protein